MAKTYINTVKYEILLKFKVDGIVDKHDIIGAIFGQSEGLLGEDLDLRELQKNGKLGRIEIVPKVMNGTTNGTISIPSSMDMVETCILAAAIETVDKVGPCGSTFITETVEDTRTLKRKMIASRAKQLLHKLMTEKLPESQEIAQQVRDLTRKAGIVDFGRERLPAGPDIESSEEVIVVEGRADVLTLLKNNIKNAIAMGGANVPQTLIELSRRKKLILFMDGDRGGLLNARKLQNLARVDSVAFAPDGKEVEELTSKEIIMALRKREPIASLRVKKLPIATKNKPFAKPIEKKPTQRLSVTKTEIETKVIKKPVPKVEDKELTKFKPTLKELEGSLKARLLDEKGKILQEVGVRELMPTIKKEKKIHTIVFDGIITKRLLDAAEQKNVKTIVGVKKGRIEESKKTKVLALD